MTGTEKLRPTGDTILHVCAEFEKMDIFKYFYRNLKTDINILNYADETPLIIAAREGKIDMVKMLCETYSDDVAVDHKMMDGWTAFFYAAMNGFINTVNYLAKQKDNNLNDIDRFHRTPLHWVARYNNLQMTSTLLELGCDFTIKDCEGMTCTELAKAHFANETHSLLITHAKRV